MPAPFSAPKTRSPASLKGRTATRDGDARYTGNSYTYIHTREQVRAHRSSVNCGMGGIQEPRWKGREKISASQSILYFFIVYAMYARPTGHPPALLSRSRSLRFAAAVRISSRDSRITFTGVRGSIRKVMIWFQVDARSRGSRRGRRFD